RFLKRFGNASIVRIRQPHSGMNGSVFDFSWANVLRDFAVAHPEIDVYFYLVPGLEDVMSDSGINYPYYHDFIPALQNELDGCVYFDYLDYNLSTVDEYFFRTDHHWNVNGAYRGYLDILDMLRKKYDDLEPLTRT